MTILRNHASRLPMLLLVATLFSAAHTAFAAPEGPPASQFFENSAFGGAAFSPNGHFLAVRKNNPGKRDFLAVIDLDTHTAAWVAGYDDADIGDFQWVNDTRLVYNLHDGSEASGYDRDAPGLYAVNRDGSKRVTLAAHDWRTRAPQPWNTFMLDQPGGQIDEWLPVEHPYYDKSDHYVGSNLFLLNTVTGVKKVPPQPKVPVGSFMLDAAGELRLAVHHGTTTALYYRDPADDAWRTLASYDSYKGAHDEIKPVGFGANGTLYVAARAGADLATLRTFDFATGQVSKEPLVSTQGYDVDATLLHVDGAVVGVRLTTDAMTSIWFDPTVKAIQAAIDKALPATINLLTLPAKAGARWLLVTAYSDVQPPLYLLYDTRTGTFDKLGAAYPHIDPASMGRQRAIRYQARDGLNIPGLLTLPPGGVAKHLPLVLLVHGGPWERGSTWGWNPESQFLATRGYAVLEVEFRGGTGLGAHHFEAGLKQWGLAMQNDLADGARWAIAEGIADPRRIAIAGASYGGYAALMGLVNDPDLYRCAIEWAGVTDFNLMYNGTWYGHSDFSETHVRYGLPALVGDLQVDAAQLNATSPLQQAARIRQPVLLAYGSEDRRVPPYHGKRLVAAMEATNRQVEWIQYSGEGHGWSLPKNRIDFWQRVERFLNQHLGAGAVTDPVTAPAPPR